MPLNRPLAPTSTVAPAPSKAFLHQYLPNIAQSCQRASIPVGTITLTWDVFAGDTTEGTPVLSVQDAWEPVLELDAPGDYTIVLNVGGIAGLAAAAAPVSVGTPACGCTSKGPPARKHV